MRILIFGEIIGKIGRRAVLKVMPELKKKFKPDFVLANGENLAHGKGITIKTVKEIMNAGIDFLTSGDHFWSKKGELKKILRLDLPVIRPANYPSKLPGAGFKLIEVKKQKILIVNLVGRVFMKEENISCPFRKFDKIFAEVAEQLKTKIKIVLVDFHAEATAEKQAFAHYVDGRVSLVFGTHTHVPTVDEKILPKGTAFITDIGMIGAKDSVIGFLPEGAIKRQLENERALLEIPEKGLSVVNGIFVEISEKTGQAKRIQRIQKEVEIK